MAAAPANSQSTALRQIATDAPDYKGYKPLDISQREIRVLDLGADLTCTIRHVSLDSSPIYHALSYCWGPSGSTKEVTIRVVDPCLNTIEVETVTLRKTVAKFLNSLYAQYGGITVWLDVICINQRSFTEQSAQVAMMGDIYRLAKSVFAWIGPWNPDIDYAFSFATATSLNQSTALYDLEKVAIGVNLIFYQPYWTRVWIVQECVLYLQLLLVCGKRSVSWPALELMARQIYKARRQSSNEHSSLGRVDDESNAATHAELESRATSARFNALRQARARLSRNEQTSLLVEVFRFQNTHCTDPRDRIFGFRALAGVAENLAVDYKSGLFELLIQAISLQNRHYFQIWSLTPIANEGDWWSGWLRQSRQSTQEEPGMISDSRLLSQLMAINVADISGGLQDQLSDWLVISLHACERKHDLHVHYLDQTCGSSDDETFASVATALPSYCLGHGWRYTISVLSNGRIVAMNLESDMDVAWQRALGETWTEHIWICPVNRAVHISRWLFANLVYADTSPRTRDGPTPGIGMIEKLSDYAPPATSAELLDKRFQHCGCEPIATASLFTSPWTGTHLDVPRHGPDPDLVAVSEVIKSSSHFAWLQWNHRRVLRGPEVQRSIQQWLFRKKAATTFEQSQEFLRLMLKALNSQTRKLLEDSG